MLDFSKVKNIVRGWWSSLTTVTHPPILCNHEHKFIDQVWEAKDRKSFVLKDRYICSLCNNSSLRDIGA